VRCPRVGPRLVRSRAGSPTAPLIIQRPQNAVSTSSPAASNPASRIVSRLSVPATFDLPPAGPPPSKPTRRPIPFAPLQEHPCGSSAAPSPNPSRHPGQITLSTQSGQVRLSQHDQQQQLRSPRHAPPQKAKSRSSPPRTRLAPAAKRRHPSEISHEPSRQRPRSHYRHDLDLLRPATHTADGDRGAGGNGSSAATTTR
jgi:hypothetical protein